MRILLATNNAHKRDEFRSIFPDDDVLTPDDLGMAFDVEETGETFLENAMLKAQALRVRLSETGSEASHADVAIVADDSGLCVDALGGAPGIYSARFGSPDGGKTELAASARNQLLIDALEGATSRGAHFVCSMVALLENDRIVVAQESWTGEIAEAPSSGTGGFGYDPVFFVPGLGKTAADLSPEEKNRLSHRGRASRVLAAALGEAASLPD
ncbi:MAG: RdgB/HAM1 family non-canonical purine NTP pyrophosphatase [Spirochaetota bacterium]